MSNPALTNYTNGTGQVSSDNLNTFMQTCTNMAELRAFPGNNSAIMVYVRGTTAANDGGQGTFYWNANVRGTDDNGVTTVVPTGVTLGCWTRQTSGTILLGTSSTTNSIALGLKTFIIAQTGVALSPGGFVVIASQANVANYMHGQIISSTGTTLVVNVTDIGGSGTHSDWSILLSGTQGTSVLTLVTSFGADPSGVNDSSAAFQAAHDNFYNLAVASGVNNPSGAVYIPSGKYKLNSGLNWVSWIKLISLSPVYLDFSGLSTSGTAFRISNDTGPASSPGKNSSNTGPILNGTQGVIFIDGPGSSGTSIGIDMGNSSSLPVERDFRDTALDGVVVSHFATLLNLRSFDTYLMTISNSRFEIGGTNCVGITSSSNTNSGERMAFENCTFAGCTNAFSVTTPAYDLNFINCSFDSNTNTALLLNNGAGYQKITYTDCHFERSNNVALVKCNVASFSNPVFVEITNCKVVPTNNIPAPTGAYTDGTSSPWTSLFQGNFHLKIDGLNFAGYDHAAYGASGGLFLCDSSVRMIEALHVTFTNFRQVIAASQVLNYNYNFNIGTSGTSLDYSSIAGWTFFTQSGITAALSNAQTYNSSTNSLAFTETAAPGANFYVIYSDPFPINQGDQLTFQNVVYGGTSTGTIRVECALLQYQVGIVPLTTITGITRSSGTATATTAVAHGLFPNQFVYVGGADQAGYNGKKIVVATPTSTTFTYKVDPATVTPATGTFTFNVEPLIPIAAGSTSGETFSTIYGTTSDPAYTGNRLWWAKAGVIPGGFTVTNITSGVTHGRVAVTVSGLNAGDVMYLGTSLMEKT